MTSADAEILAKKLFQLHGLSHYSFKLNRARTYYGRCYIEHNRIELSKYFIEIESDKNIELILLHEIAHALTPDDNHGKLWQQKCVELGIEPVIRHKLKSLPSLYWAKCKKCNTKYNKNRYPKKQFCCGHCGYEKVLVWHKNVVIKI